MKKTLILIFFVASSAIAFARYQNSFSTTRPNSGKEAISNSTATFSGSYIVPTSTIYEPFTNETPSSLGGPNRAGENNGGPGGPTVTPGETTDPTINPDPIGDALLPLSIIALCYMGFSLFRRRKKA